MAITALHLTTSGSTADATSYTTASISPSANKLILCAVGADRTGSDALIPAVSGCGLTWEQVSTALGAGNRRFTLFRAMGASPSAEALTFDFGGVTHVHCRWTISEFDGVDTSGSNGAGAIVQSQEVTAGSYPPAEALDAPLASATNAIYASFFIAANRTFTAGAEYTELGTESGSTEGHTIASEWAVGPSPETIDATFSSSASYALLAVEIKEAVVLDTFTFTTQPVNTQEDTVMANIVVESSDAGSTAEVTIVITSAGGAILSGDNVKSMVAGSVTFNDLEIDVVGTYTFTVSATGHEDAESNSFEITLEPATHLFIFEGPSNTQVNTPIQPPIVIRARNSENVIDTNYNETCVVSRLAGTGTLSGTGGESDLIVDFVNGIATFSTLTSDVVEAGYQLRFESGALTLADSDSFEWTESAPPSDPDQGFDMIMSGILHMRL